MSKRDRKDQAAARMYEALKCAEDFISILNITRPLLVQDFCLRVMEYDNVEKLIQMMGDAMDEYSDLNENIKP